MEPLRRGSQGKSEAKGHKSTDKLKLLHIDRIYEHDVEI